jgi:hypothetical protein
MMRIHRHAAVALVACAAALAGGCQGDGAAVSVRWRLMQLKTGVSWDPNQREVAAADGECCLLKDTMGLCTADNTWIVGKVSVTLHNPDTGAPVVTVSPASDCAARELTSSFSLPIGTFAVSVNAQVFDGQGHASPSATPAADVRDFTAGAVVNLPVTEIAVDLPPVPLPPSGTGVTS